MSQNSNRIRTNNFLRLMLVTLVFLNFFITFHLSLNEFLEKNVVDKLYLSLKDKNVIDKGLKELLTPPKVYAATFSIQTGYYVGNNNDNRQISGLGFSPDLVILKDNTTAGSEGMIFKTSSMSSELTLTMSETDANLTTNHIQSLDSDGFTVGTDTDVNTANVMYYYTAFSGSDCSSTGTFCVGSYTGNGTSLGITSVGFQPDLVFVKRSGSAVGIWKSSSMSGTASNYFHNANELATEGISSLDATGFTVGNNTSVNINASTYYYFAFKEVANYMDVGTYTGDGVDNRSIDSSDDSNLTFLPDFVWTKNSSAATAQTLVASFRENYGDRSVYATDTASAANNIQSLLPGGGFQIGTTANVNSSTVVYYYVAFGGASARSPGSGSFEMDSGTYTGTGSGFSVSGLGFSPDLVLIKGDTTQYGVFRTSLMSGDRTNYLGNAASVFTGGIASIDSDGFTVGTNAATNTSSVVYHWSAFGNAMRPDKSGGSSDFYVGQYVGAGSDNQDVRGLPISPDLVVVKRVGTTAGTFRTSNQSGDSSIGFHALASTANIIQALNSDGFEKGNSSYLNSSGSTYDFFAFEHSSNFATGTLTGNGSSQSITSVGFQPDQIWIKKVSGGTARAGALRFQTQSGDSTLPFLNTGTFTGGITGVLSNGFSVGSSTYSNENTFSYQYVAWREPVTTVVSVTINSDAIVNYGTLVLGANKSTISGDLNDLQTAENDGNVSEVFNIKGQNTSCAWTLSTSGGTDQYAHKFCNSSENSCTSPPTNFTPLTTNYQTLQSSVSVSETVDFHLRIEMPTATSCYTQQNVDVTIQAVEE